MNLIKLFGQSYRIPDAWDTFTVGGKVFRRRHAGAFILVTASGRELVFPCEFC